MGVAIFAVFIAKFQRVLEVHFVLFKEAAYLIKQSQGTVNCNVEKAWLLIEYSVCCFRWALTFQSARDF